MRRSEGFEFDLPSAIVNAQPQGVSVLDFGSIDLSFGGYLDPWIVAQALAFIQVVFIDLVMAGDNAVAVGVAAAGLPADKRKQAIFFGVAGAVIVRIGFVLITYELLKIVGLLLAGGLLLLWVTWKMFRELRHPHDEAAGASPRKAKSLLSAVVQILIADISMSLDNVLAVTGAAEEHVWILAFGLLFSIALMGIAANMIASVLHKYVWIGYLGVLVVLFVALKMIWEGGHEVWTVGHCDTKGIAKCGPFLWQSFQTWAAGLLRLLPH